MRTLFILPVLLFAVVVTGCRDPQPRPAPPPGITVDAPFVHVNVPDAGR